MEDVSGGFEIDGRTYEIPGIDTFDMDEAMLLYEYAGLTLQDFAAIDPDDDDPEAAEAERARKLQHPGLLKTLVHIAYARGNPDVKPARIKALVGKVNVLEVLKADEEEDAESPPASESTSAPEPPSQRSSLDSNSSSGVSSPNGSGSPDETPEPTGATKSDTSPTSALAT